MSLIDSRIMYACTYAQCDEYVNFTYNRVHDIAYESSRALIIICCTSLFLRCHVSEEFDVRRIKDKSLQIMQQK